MIQPRLREIDRFFFITRGRRLFTEVLAPDGIASGLARGILGRSPCEDAERSCEVTLFADDVFEKSLLEKGTADECAHTVARRMGEVNLALETCGLRQNAGNG